jgi:hypothetical protein
MSNITISDPVMTLVMGIMDTVRVGINARMEYLRMMDKETQQKCIARAEAGEQIAFDVLVRPIGDIAHWLRSEVFQIKDDSTPTK